ncbi:hypothetical protein FS749_009456 [Ceratobasidium sp. UAMH 11750]|nr:hypothetical protein FS749_009456 [Ceratobasidium sp. UAMH 11750]
MDIGEGGDEVVASRASAVGPSKRARSRTPPVVQKRKRHIEEVEDLSGAEGKGDEGAGPKRKDKTSKGKGKQRNEEVKELLDAEEKGDEDELKRKDKTLKGKRKQRTEERKNRTLKGKGKQGSKAVEGVGSDTEGKEGEVGSKGQDRVFDNAFKGVVRKAFYSLEGWKDGNSVEPTQRDEDGKSTYWRETVPGRRVVTPAWEEDFDENYEQWGTEYLGTFRQLAKKDAHAPRLAKMTDADVRMRLKVSPWTTCAKVGKAKGNGRFEEACQKHNLLSLENYCRTNLLVSRINACVGTCLEGKEFDFQEDWVG